MKKAEPASQIWDQTPPVRTRGTIHGEFIPDCWAEAGADEGSRGLVVSLGGWSLLADPGKSLNSILAKLARLTIPDGRYRSPTRFAPLRLGVHWQTNREAWSRLSDRPAPRSVRIRRPAEQGMSPVDPGRFEPEDIR